MMIIVNGLIQIASKRSKLEVMKKGGTEWENNLEGKTPTA